MKPRHQTVVAFTNGHEFTVRHREPLLRYFRDRGWAVVGMAPGASPAAKRFADLGFRQETLSLSRAGMNPLNEIRAIWSVVKRYRRLRPDLVIHATVKPVLYGTLAAAWLGLPVVNLITGLGFAYSASTPRALIARAAISAAYGLVFLYRRQRVVFQNHDDFRELATHAGLREERAIVVPGSGVDIDTFADIATAEHLDSSPPNVVFPGRMLYDKGVADFVEAASIVRNQLPTVRFILVGPADPGNPAGVPVSVLQSWQAAGIVEWSGVVEDMREVYRHATLVVLPSRREGMPKVVLEAAACGLPVVTTRVPGCREAVIDGHTGILVPHGDPQALASAILRILTDEKLRTAMGTNARKLAENRFAAPLIVKQIANAALELL